jgi:hypothetical protein
VEGHTLLLPTETLQDPRILEKVLSMDTWNNILTDHDRCYLKRYLPPNIFTNDQKLDVALSELLGGKNLHFGNDKEILIRRLLCMFVHVTHSNIVAGYYHPFITKQREYVQYLQRKEYELDVQMNQYQINKSVYEQKVKAGLIKEGEKKKLVPVPAPAPVPTPQRNDILMGDMQHDSIFDDDDDEMEEEDQNGGHGGNLMIDE